MINQSFVELQLCIHQQCGLCVYVCVCVCVPVSWPGVRVRAFRVACVCVSESLCVNVCVPGMHAPVFSMP